MDTERLAELHQRYRGRLPEIFKVDLFIKEGMAAMKGIDIEVKTNLPKDFNADIDKEELKKQLAHHRSRMAKAAKKEATDEKDLSSLITLVMLANLHRDLVREIIVEFVEGLERKNLPKSVNDNEHDFKMYAMEQTFANYGEVLSIVMGDKEFLELVRDAAKRKYEEKTYSKALQGEAISRLLLVGKKGQEHQGDNIISQFGRVRFLFKESSKYKEVALPPPIALLQHLIHAKLADSIQWDKIGGKPSKIKNLRDYLRFKQRFVVEITTDEYIQLTGAKSPKKVVTQKISKMIDRLFDVCFSYEYEGVTYKGRLYQGVMEKTRGGIFRLNPTDDFLMCCMTSRPADYHLGIYRADYVHFPYSVNIYFKLWWQYMISRGEAGNGLLKVKNLLADVPDLPSVEEMKERGNRHYNRDIKDQLERSLDELIRVESILSWEYNNAHGKAVPEKQLDGLSFDEWQELYLKYIPNLPDQDPYIEAHRKKIEAAKMKANRRRTKKS